MRKIEKLAVAQALYKVVAKAVSTKDSDNLRSDMDAVAYQRYVSDGIKSQDIIINDMKVGTYSVRMTKEVPPKPASTHERAALENLAQWESWLVTLPSDELAVLTRFIVQTCGVDAFADWWLHETGQLPGGCEMLTITEPATDGEPAHYAGTVLKVDEKRVAQALQEELPAVVAGLLGGGE